MIFGFAADTEHASKAKACRDDAQHPTYPGANGANGGLSVLSFSCNWILLTPL